MTRLIDMESRDDVYCRSANKPGFYLRLDVLGIDDTSHNADRPLKLLNESSYRETWN